MIILGLELEEWWDLIKILVRVSLMTMAVLFLGTWIHEGAHIFVALFFGREVVYFYITGFLGAEAGIRAGSYLVPIAFAGGFVEGLYILVVRRYIKSQGLWIATLSCWAYALAEVWWVLPPVHSSAATLLLTAMRCLMYVAFFAGYGYPQLKQLCDFSDYQKASVVLPVWVPSEHRRGR